MNLYLKTIFFQLIPVAIWTLPINGGEVKLRENRLPRISFSVLLGNRTQLDLPDLFYWDYHEHFEPQASILDGYPSALTGAETQIRIWGRWHLVIGYRGFTIKDYREFPIDLFRSPKHIYRTTEAGVDINIFSLDTAYALETKYGFFLFPYMGIDFLRSRWSYSYELYEHLVFMNSFNYDKIWRNRGFNLGVRLIYPLREHFSLFGQLEFHRYREHYYDKYRLHQLCTPTEFPKYICYQMDISSNMGKYRVYPRFFSFQAGIALHDSLILSPLSNLIQRFKD